MNRVYLENRLEKKISSVQVPRSSQPLELVHSDVCGPFQVETYDKHRYFVTFIDDYTHFCCVYLIKSKSDVFDMFVEFSTMASSHFNLGIQRLRCDNGGEYRNHKLLNFCKERGILCEFTVPYTPEQNGVSERMNRTLVEKGRTMLIESRLSNCLWGEAILISNYLNNRSPTNAISDFKTPYEKWHNKKPDISKLQVFGTIAFAHIPNERRKKLDCKSLKCYFVGYSPNGYRLWDDKNHKLFIARDVIFNQDISSKINETDDKSDKMKSLNDSVE